MDIASYKVHRAETDKRAIQKFKERRTRFPQESVELAITWLSITLPYVFVDLRALIKKEGLYE
jgi:hypothetical protein